MTDEPIVQEVKQELEKVVSGKTTREKLENASYMLIIISAVMVSVGIGLGSFIAGTVVVAVIGAFLVMVGIVMFIASQLMGE
jgi:hypothetical protein